MLHSNRLGNRFPSALSGASAYTLSAQTFSDSELVSDARLRNHFDKRFFLAITKILKGINRLKFVCGQLISIILSLWFLTWDIIFSSILYQGSHMSWKTWKIKIKIPDPGNVLEFCKIRKCPGKNIACEIKKIYLEQKRQ